MFDSLTIARQLTEAGIDRAQADVLADAIRQAAEHGDHVTPERLDAALAALEARLTWRFRRRDARADGRHHRRYGRPGAAPRSRMIRPGRPSPRSTA